MKKSILSKLFLKKLSILFTLLIISISFSFAQLSTPDNPKVEDNVTVTAQVKKTPPPNFSDIEGIIQNFNQNIVKNLVVLLSGVALVVFLWGLVMFIVNRNRGKDGESLAKEKKAMMWGLIALFVLVSLWGIITMAQDMLIGSRNNNINLPKICIDGDCEGGSNTPTNSGGGQGGVFNDPTDRLGGGRQVFNDGSYTPDDVYTWAIMKSGDNTKKVAQLQQFLKDKGYYNTTIDGQFGTNTVNAVKAFQTANKLVADGQVGPSTKAVILYRHLNYPSPDGIGDIRSWTDLSYGSTGDRVKLLQQFLKSAGCYAAGSNTDADSIFGAGTRQAVQNYQQANFLKEDTIVGPSTRAVMMSMETYDC